MSLARSAAALAVAGATLLPAGAGADPVCVSREHYQYACHDPDHPGCVVYGTLGEEAMFHLGEGCPWPWGNG